MIRLLLSNAGLEVVPQDTILNIVISLKDAIAKKDIMSQRPGYTSASVRSGMEPTPKNSIY
jgi:hypothetical protein